MKKLFFILSVLICISCDMEVTNNSSDEKSNLKVGLINEFTAEGKDKSVELFWNPISSEYDVYISYEIDSSDGKQENILVDEVKIDSGKNTYTVNNLINATKDLYYYYNFTLIVKNKNGKILEQHNAGATPATTQWDYEDGETLNVWTYLLDPDSIIPSGKDFSNTSFCSRDLVHPYVAKIKGANHYVYPSIYNNPDSVTALFQKGGFQETEQYKNCFLSHLHDGEEIQWFATFRAGARIELYGKIVNSTIDKNGYNEAQEVFLDTVEDIKNLSEGYRVGTKVFTKGYYSVGDGGNAIYEISNRPLYKYGSIQTGIGQYCNIVVENNCMNLVSLGAGKCFQVTKANKAEWESYKTKNNGQGMNDDADRIAEAKKMLVSSRKNSKDVVTLFIPKGNYRLGSSIVILEENFQLKGETNRRDVIPEELDSFEQNYALGNEIGSSNFSGTVLYTDNGSSFGGFNIYGPANNILVEGITLEARETDSKKTYWHSVDDKYGEPHTDINYEGRGTTDKSMADEQWYSRQVQISQCSNVTIRNCEFIITSHIRDEAVYENGEEYKYNSDGSVWMYRANPYVETCDMHTDKQFTSVTFFDSWHNVTVDDCLLYNMSGVFRGASFGFLDIYGGQCSNGTLSNSTLYHNCHDEQIGIFTLTENAGNYKETEYIDGVNIFGNKVYPMRDEHVDKIKPRVMVISTGYDGSKNIRNVSIKKNTFYAENLPSKLITFGGFLWDGRENIVVSENIINMKNSGGSYMFETRPYVEVRNNVINLDSDSGFIGGSIFDCSNKDTKTGVEPRFEGNTVNINCGYSGHITHNGGSYNNGIVKGNTINIKGNFSSDLFGGNSIVSDNKVIANGRMRTFYTTGAFRTLASDILINNNELIYNFDDTSDDYTLSQNDGGFRESGREGCTFVEAMKTNQGDKTYSIIVTGNKITAKSCTTRNKHILRYRETSVPVIISSNKIEKFYYLRGVKEENQNTIIYLNNIDSKGNALNKSDWLFENTLKDTD